MRALDRYLLKEILVPFAVGLGLFFVVVAFAQLLKVSDSVTGLGVSGSTLLRAFGFSLPPLAGILIPVSILFATLLGVGRLSADREVIAMTAVGVSPFRLLRVPAILGIALACVSAFAMIVGEPWGITGLKTLMARNAQTSLAGGIRAGEFVEWTPDMTFLARGKQGNRLQHVVFADRRDARRPIMVSAKHGEVKIGERPEDILFELEDGAILLYSPGSDSQRLIRFDQGKYRIDVSKLVGGKFHTAHEAQSWTFSRLWEESRTAPKESKRALYTIVLHRKLALPLATLIFALLAVPLAIRSTSGARARGFLYSTLIVGAYYYIGRAVELSARSGGFPPWLAAWVPNIIGVIALLLMLRRFRKAGA